MNAPHRRDWLLQTGAAAAGLALAANPLSANPNTVNSTAAAQLAGEVDSARVKKIQYCLNTSSVRGERPGRPLVELIAAAEQAGYDALEPWLGEIGAYTQSGGTLADLRKRLADAGLQVASAIGFAQWIVDDDTARAAALEALKRDMDIVAQLGGTRIAAPPAGATNQTDLNLFRAAERYRAACELGEEMGVSPQLELWGFSKSLSRLGELAFVAAEAGHPRACLLPDVYHIYKGGSEFAGLAMLNGGRIEVFHMNDYPAEPPRAQIGDADRVYPGDGIAPLGEILRTMVRAGFEGTLSLELFNRDYWKQDPLEVARLGLEKMRAAVAAAFA